MATRAITQANEMLGTIIQKVGKQEYATKGYSNPLASLKRENIDGATKIEEIYVERALAKEEDPTGADTLARVTQDIKTRYRQKTFAKCYTVTIQDNEVREGFKNKEGVSKLADKKIEALNRGISIDDYKQMEGAINLIPSLTGAKKQTITNPTTLDDVKKLMKLVQTHSDDMVYSSKKYCADFETDTPKDKQVIFTTPEVYAEIKVELATIFNVSLAELKQRVHLVQQFTDTKVKMVLADEGILRCHNTLYNHETQRNAKGMFTNHHVNVQGIYAVSEMYNAIIYTTA